MPLYLLGSTQNSQGFIVDIWRTNACSYTWICWLKLMKWTIRPSPQLIERNAEHLIHWRDPTYAMQSEHKLQSRSQSIHNLLHFIWLFDVETSSHTVEEPNDVQKPDRTVISSSQKQTAYSPLQNPSWINQALLSDLKRTLNQYLTARIF